MKRSLLTLCLTAGMLLLLSGCFFKSAAELYAVPRPAEEFQQLQTKIDEVREGAEYAAPLQGSNTQTVQLVDLDRDGVPEAITFFRISGVENPLKIYIFRQDQSGSYQVMNIIEGEGTSIRSVAYLNLGGADSLELVVAWQLSSTVHTLTAYSVAGEEVSNLLLTKYTSYKAVDLDRDGDSELLVVQADAAGVGDGRVELYDYRDDAMALHSSAPLSHGLDELGTGTVGLTSDAVPALFLTSKYADGSAITDLFTLQDGALKNVTLNPATGRSDQTKRLYTVATPTDINGDGILEIPHPIALPAPSALMTADLFHVIEWLQYDSTGASFPVFTTYHSYNTYDRWYLILPDDWLGKITLSRSDNASSGERAVLFSWWNGDEETTPEPFLIIYKLTGTNRELRSKLGGRFLLRVESDAIYAAEFKPSQTDCGLDEAGLAECFDLIRIAWSAES